MGYGNTISITVVKGGFILQQLSEDGGETEIFNSPGKLLKAVRTIIEAGKPVKDKDSDTDE